MNKISLCVFDNDESNHPVAYALCPMGEEAECIRAAKEQGGVGDAKWVDVFEFSGNFQDIYYIREGQSFFNESRRINLT